VGPLCQASDEAHLPKEISIELRKARLSQMLGMEIPEPDVEAILEGLGLRAQKVSEAWSVSIPSYRFDLSIEEDLVEEIARVYGYNSLPSSPLMFPQRLAQKTETSIEKSVFLQKLNDLAYQESICYSFIDEKSQALFSPEDEQIVLANPISSELSVMRGSLWPGLVKAAVFNQHRQQHELRLFEHGLVFHKQNDKLMQEAKLAGLLSAKAQPLVWDGSQKEQDFYDMKADVEALLDLSLGEYRFEKAEHPALHSGQSASVIKGEKLIGYMGALHPQVAKSMDLAQECFVFELDLAELRQKSLPKYQLVSKFPGTSRDLALIVDKELPAQSLLDTAYQVKSDILQGISIFDLYEGANIGEGKKSIAITLSFQHPDRTLEELEVTDFVDKMTNKLEQSFDAKLRD
jgi:phenylalanyl-tRNA synthetase beta chain